MPSQQYTFAKYSQEAGVRELLGWRDAATVIMAGALSASNPSLTYTTHIATNPTNPKISLCSEDISAWFDEDGAELSKFIALVDKEMANNTNSVIAADEAQLDRIARLIAGVSA